MSEYIDVTVSLKDKAMCFPSDPQCSIEPHWEIKEGDLVNLDTYAFGSHTGTHIDAPYHFCEDGLKADELSLDCFIGKAKVFDFSKKKSYIDLDDVKNLNIEKGDIVLFKTSNSAIMREQVFREDFVYITPSVAGFLVDKQIATFGFDFLSMEKFDSDNYGAHLALLGADIVIIEGLDLTEVSQGTYEIISLPMLIKDANGSPIRVLLKEIK